MGYCIDTAIERRQVKKFLQVKLSNEIHELVSVTKCETKYMFTLGKFVHIFTSPEPVHQVETRKQLREHQEKMMFFPI